MTYRMKISHWMGLSDRLDKLGIAYEFKPLRNDGFMYEKKNKDGISKFHIHSIEELDQTTDEMTFTHLLPKSSNFRDGLDVINLASIDAADWHTSCSGMDSSTLKTVSALSEIFISLGLIRPTE